MEGAGARLERVTTTVLRTASVRCYSEFRPHAPAAHRWVLAASLPITRPPGGDRRRRALYGVDGWGRSLFQCSRSAAHVMVAAPRGRGVRPIDLVGIWCGGWQGRAVSPCAADSASDDLLEDGSESGPPRGL